MSPDPYQTLGVKREATQEEIRRAYRNLAKKHHPDLNPGNAAAEERFKQISAANEFLSDEARRARFDRGEIDASGQPTGPPPGYRAHAEGTQGRRYAPEGAEAAGWSEEDLRDVFGSIFGERMHQGRPTVMRGQDLRYVLTVAFLDAVNGATKRLALPDGRTLDVRVPPGSVDGQVLRLRGQGEPGFNGGPDGDALIELQVAAHPVFERDGDDIRLVLPVTLKEAVLGGPVEVPTPKGRVRMQIPAHSDSGTELRLRGRGVPAHGDRPAGNLYATLRVVLGAPDPALDEFLRGWTPAGARDPRAGMEDV